MPSLQDTLKTLIARDLGVTPEKITPEFVREWRDSHTSNESCLEFRSHYGGYHGSRLRRLTRKQIEVNRQRAEEFLGQYSSDTQ